MIGESLQRLTLHGVWSCFVISPPHSPLSSPFSLPPPPLTRLTNVNAIMDTQKKAHSVERRDINHRRGTASGCRRPDVHPGTCGHSRAMQENRVRVFMKAEV
ncbi:hypothetical protein BaRGS_00038790 [Batillaria attramentaria]|uniref:Uncharacterized protein n=1 Tax=Batillaria attramentaria TaxID=370345 RepID=A0ABD0J548_9CAEN